MTEPANVPQDAADRDTGDRGWAFAAGVYGGFVGVFVMGLIILLVAFGGSSGGDAAAADAGGSVADGAAIFGSRCATCHGADGAGGFGPRLSRRVATVYPDIADQIAVISAGRDAMPAWGNVLSDTEIEAVARFTREGL
ncbi:MAG: c-type cytochrome [Acidimicrobiales bacterium]